MLRLSIHAGRLKDITRFNRLDWIDIGYEKLSAPATYKVVYFRVGVGATPPVFLKNYPRWSASLWDLVARAIAVASSADPKNPVEAMPAIELKDRGFAFADALCAILEHHPAKGPAGRLLGTMEVLPHKGKRGRYRATIEEDLMPGLSSIPFEFHPKMLRPAELVLKAAVTALSGQADALPKRPDQVLPVRRIVDGKPYVFVHRIAEPARTGFLRWLYRESEPPIAHKDARDGIAPESMFTKFLEVAV